MKPILYNSSFKLAWNMVILASIMGFTFLVTYRLVFRTFQADEFYYLLNTLFLVDVILGFFTASKRGHIRLETLPEIRDNYLRSWFTIDLLAFLPFELVPIVLYGGIPTDPLGTSLYLGAQCLTLIKSVKAVRIFEELREALGFSPGLHRLIGFAYWFVQALHIMALGWILIGAGEADRPHFDQYLRALYWVTTTIATIGYGDYYPDHDSNLQITYTIAIQLFGVGMYSFIIANVSSLVANIDIARASYQRRLEEVNAFLKSQKIPHELQDRVRDYYSYLWSEKRSVESSSVVEDLPQSLSMEILMFQNADLVRRVEVFRGADDLMVREAVKTLHARVFLPQEYIIRQGEYGDCMYFVSSGELAVLIDGREVARIGPGSLFGETALVTDERRNASIRALSYGTGYVLSKADFVDLRAKYPEFDARVREIVAKRTRINAGGTGG